MYAPAHFRCDDLARLHRLMDENPFAVLTTPDGSISHVPLLLLPDDGEKGALFGHVARANPQANALAEMGRATAVLSGPHAYVSPKWYASAPNVPTWNYAAIHASGPARILERDEFVLRLGQLFDRFEPDGWRDETTEAYLEKLVPAIVGFVLEIETLEGAFKLSQNKSDADFSGVVVGLESVGQTNLATLMREFREA